MRMMFRNEYWSYGFTLFKSPKLCQSKPAVLRLAAVLLIVLFLVQLSSAFDVGDTLNYREVSDIKLFGNKNGKIHIESRVRLEIVDMSKTEITYRVHFDEYSVTTDPKNPELERELREFVMLMDGKEVTVNISREGTVPGIVYEDIEKLLTAVEYMSYFGDVYFEIYPQFGMYGTLPVIKVDAHVDWKFNGSEYKMEIVSNSREIVDMVYGIPVYSYAKMTFVSPYMNMDVNAEAALESGLNVNPVVEGLKILTSGGEVEGYVAGESVEAENAKISDYDEVTVTLRAEKSGIASYIAKVPGKVKIEEATLDGKEIEVKNLAAEASQIVYGGEEFGWTDGTRIGGAGTGETGGSAGGGYSTGWSGSFENVEGEEIYAIPMYISSGKHKLELEFNRKVVDLEPFKPELKQISVPQSSLLPPFLSQLPPLFLIPPLVGVVLLVWQLLKRKKRVCPFCGVEIEEGWVSCPSCGHRLR